jgi:hypothetical protein
MKKQTWTQWARAVGRDPNSPSKLKSQSLAALTGQDTRALDAIVAALDLYVCGDSDGRRGALEAVRALLPAMQESTRWIARELIPFVLNWEDRERLWPLVAPREALLAARPSLRLVVGRSGGDGE